MDRICISRAKDAELLIEMNILMEMVHIDEAK
jgi:hypothetical protein